jgi:prepilin-type processing-associated H-X9-DG protein
MKTFFHFNSDGSNRAFAKIELLVVVIVMAMFGSMVASASRGAQNQVKIAECAANLRQFALSHLLYAGDNADKLPIQALASGYWPWDIGINIGTVMNQYGTPWQVMYCPGTAPRFQTSDNLLLYQYGGSSFHVIGYVPTLAPASGGSPLNATNLNYSVMPQPIPFGPTFLRPPTPAKRVLIADANISSGGNYVTISGGFGGANNTHLSPHLNGILPAGGNLAMLDGHVEWRPFSQMQIRTSPGGVPQFLW